VLGGLRDRLNEIKPDPVDQPERTVHYDCAMCIAEMLRNTRLEHRDSSVNIPVPPDQHHCSDEAWRIGGRESFRLYTALSQSI